jgi:hypothetical protein
MFVCLIVWFFISILSVFSAFSLLSIFLEKKEIIKLLGIQPFLTSFIGTLALSNLFMILAFFSSLRITHLVVVSIAVLSYAFFSLTRQDVQTLADILRENFLTMLISSALSFFLISIPHHEASDIVGYHIQMAKYLHEYGLVTGLALIHPQLGHQSIWFALPAPFEDFLGIYSSLIVGGFSLFISFCQFFRSLSRINKDIYEFFLVCFFLLSFVAFYARVYVTSVEVPLNIIIGMTVFCSLRYFSSEDETPDSEVKHLFFWPAVIFPSFGFALKLTGIPVFLFGIYLFIHRFGFKLNKSHLRWGIITTILVLTKLTASALTSGCPLYPSSLFHLQAPWFIGENSSKEVIELITTFARLEVTKAPENINHLNWIFPWSKTLGGKGVIYLFIFLMILILSCILVLKKDFLIFCKKYTSVLLFAAVGVLYVFINAPRVKFMGPYIITMVSMFLLATFQKDAILSSLSLVASFSISEIMVANRKLGLIQALLLLLLVISSTLYREKYKQFIFLTAYTHKLVLHLAYFTALTFYSSTNTNLLLLPEVSSLKRQFTSQDINGVKFFFPKNSISCGYSPLPCSLGKVWSEFSLEDIELIDKEKGIAGGFKRKNYSPE